MDFLSGFFSVAFDFLKPPTKQGNYLIHNRELGLQASGHIQTPLGHAYAYRAFRGLVSSNNCGSAWGRRVANFHLLPRGGSLYLGHIALTAERLYLAEKTYTITSESSFRENC